MSGDEIEHKSIWTNRDVKGHTSSPTALTSTQTALIDSQYSDKGQGHSRPTGNKSVTRVVACTAITFLLVCFIMVGFSLIMSKDIDQQVRNSNEMLRKHNDRMAGVKDADIPMMNSTTNS